MSGGPYHLLRWVDQGITPPRADRKVHGPQHGTPVNGNAQLCGLSVWTTDITKVDLKKMYGSKAKYVKKVDARLKELEAVGWSLPVYHNLILADAKAVEFYGG